MSLLVAIDFSEITGKILERVQELALNYKAKVWLIHVAQPDPDFIGYQAGPESERNFVAHRFHELHKKLQDKASELREAGVDVTPLLVQGPTTVTILKEADKLKADLIVVGSHGYGTMFRMLVGSVSKGLLNKSTIPLLIIPAKK